MVAIQIHERRITHSNKIGHILIFIQCPGAYGNIGVSPYVCIERLEAIGCVAVTNGVQT